MVCQITNLGLFGNPCITGPSFGWHGGIYLYAGGLWVGAIGADNRDGRIDEESLNGRDDDGDGWIGEDFAAISPDMLACDYSDMTREAMAQVPGHLPLGIKVSQRSFAWPADPYRNFIGFDHTIMNIGDQHLRNRAAIVAWPCSRPAQNSTAPTSSRSTPARPPTRAAWNCSRPLPT